MSEVSEKTQELENGNQGNGSCCKKKTVMKKSAPRKHSLSSLFCILHERKLRAAAPQKHSLRSLSEILNERKLREQALWHQ